MAHYAAHFTKIDHTTKKLVKELIDLDQLPHTHKDILKRMFALYSQGCVWDAFNNDMQNPEYMRTLGCKFENGRFWWTKEITDLPIYKILEDMSFVLSIRQGLVAHEDTSYMEQNEKTLKEFLQ